MPEKSSGQSYFFNQFIAVYQILIHLPGMKFWSRWRSCLTPFFEGFLWIFLFGCNIERTYCQEHWKSPATCKVKDLEFRPRSPLLAVAHRLALSFTHLCCGQGDWVWLKKFETGAVHHLRQSSTSILRKVGTGDGWVCGGKVARGTFVAAGYFYSCLLFIQWIVHRGPILPSEICRNGPRTIASDKLTNDPCVSQQLAEPHPGHDTSKLVQCWMYDESSKWPCLEQQSGLEDVIPASVRAGWGTGSDFHVLFVDRVAQIWLCVSLGFALCLQLRCLLEVNL